MKEQCGNCRFWVASLAECRYEPPRATLAPWPRTKKTDWCGKWEAPYPGAQKPSENPNPKYLKLKQGNTTLWMRCEAEDTITVTIENNLNYKQSVVLTRGFAEGILEFIDNWLNPEEEK